MPDSKSWIAKLSYNKYGIVAFAVIAVLGLTTLLYAMVSKPGLHPLSQECVSCHMTGADTTLTNASLLTSSQEQLCGGCHANSLKMSHPSGISPSHSYIFPADYPRDWKGDLTCSTCHEVHSDQPGKLRGTLTGRDICVTCHGQPFFDGMRDGGASLMLSGHLGISGSQNWLTLDPYSVQCMECHATRGDVLVDPSMVVRHGSQNHPVGRNYAAAELEGGYTKAALLPKNIQLPNGMVSCVSCHETYTRSHGKVITTGNITTLCFECHDL